MSTKQKSYWTRVNCLLIANIHACKRNLGNLTIWLRSMIRHGMWNNEWEYEIGNWNPLRKWSGGVKDGGGNWSIRGFKALECPPIHIILIRRRETVREQCIELGMAVYKWLDISWERFQSLLTNFFGSPSFFASQEEESDQFLSVSWVQHRVPSLSPFMTMKSPTISKVKLFNLISIHVLYDSKTI